MPTFEPDKMKVEQQQEFQFKGTECLNGKQSALSTGSSMLQEARIWQACQGH